MGRLGRSLIKSLRSINSDAKNTWDLFKDKPLKERIYMVLYTCDALDPVFDVYYSIRSFISNIRRLIEYAPIVWQHRNWDYGFILRFNAKLHEDLYKGCYVEGHHVYTKSEARRLKAVIALYKRLEDDSYGDWHHDYLEKKYGESDIYFPQVTDGTTGRTYTTMRNRREDILTPEQQKQYDKDRKRLWALEEYQRKADLELLGKYIAKYSKKWWD